MLRLWPAALVTCVLFALSAYAAEPAGDGLVLWLDAGKVESVERTGDGAVHNWRDRSPTANQAQQSSPAHQPRWVSDAVQGQPAIRFDGDDFLNLGQPSALDFQPGDPFTIVTVARVADQDSGTFLAKGGGAASQRAYQVYVAPGRRGAIVYGAMQEKQGRSSQAEISVSVCQGDRADVLVNGSPCFSFRPGRSGSDADVLVGARRKEADNSGIYYALKGDLAEVLVYDRALESSELARLGDYLKTKYAMEDIFWDSGDLHRMVARLTADDAAVDLASLASALTRDSASAANELRALLKTHPDAASMTAELLLRIAEKNQLDAPLAEVAAGLLEHDDAFVRGMVEWAISMQVGSENNGQSAVWPKPDMPKWLDRWQRTTPASRIEADWVRQAVAQRIHRDSKRLEDSVEQMIRRTERMRTKRPFCPDLVNGLARLRALRNQMPKDLMGCRRTWIEARSEMRKIAMSDPALDFDRVVFVKQFAPHTVRNITRSYAWKHKPGGDICLLSGYRTGGSVHEVLQGRLGPGYVWGLDLWWDADRVVFGYARQSNWPPAVDTADSGTEGRNVFQLRQQHEPLHIFQASLLDDNIDQLTDDPYWSDFEPTYCANGDIVFASDRCGRSAECGNDTYDHTNPNLYIMSGDGSRLRKWTDSKDIDRYPHSLDDGRIAYTHWEYQERHFMEVHALWTARPNGTMSDALFKHHMPAPCGLRDTRSIPNSRKLVSIATGHHTFAYGPVVMVDPTRGMNDVEGLKIVTPGVRPQEGPMAGQPVVDGGVDDQGGLYQTPWALSETSFLVAYSYARPNCTAPAGADSNGFGLYYIDTFGNRELLHRDPWLCSVFPIPLKRRPRPPIVPESDIATDSTADATSGTCYVADVYDGMPDVERGAVKYLRISQHIGWPFDTEHGQMDYIPGNAGSRQVAFQSWSPVRVIGTVPVEADGSAAFHVPADTAVYFQALDEREMEIRRMRSVVSLKAGEVRGCTGCHESRAWTSTVAQGMPLAMLREPSRPLPPTWGADRLLGYEWLIQPILNDYCVRCHGADEPQGGLDFSGTRDGDGMYRSFHTMFGRLSCQEDAGPALVSCSDRFSDSSVTRTMQFGSHKSPLVRVLLDDELHRDEVNMDPLDWTALVTWVDANAPYYDAFLNKRPADGDGPHRKGGRPAPTESELTLDDKE